MHNIVFDEADLFFSRDEALRFQRFSAQCRSAGGWIIGERFDDRFDTEVGGFHTIAEQWIDAEGMPQGDWKRTPDGEIASERSASVIVDYEDKGKRYTDHEAAGMPGFAEVLARLRERDAAYVAFLAKKAAAKARFETRARLYSGECERRRVRFLPAQVMRSIYNAAGV